MSIKYHDAVKFKFTDVDENRSGCIGAAQQAFGSVAGGWATTFDQAHIVICRPDQFARFLIYRYQKVRGNGFKQFEPKLIGSPTPYVVDVTGN